MAIIYSSEILESTLHCLRIYSVLLCQCFFNSDRQTTCRPRSHIPLSTVKSSISKLKTQYVYLLKKYKTKTSSSVTLFHTVDPADDQALQASNKQNVKGGGIPVQQLEQIDSALGRMEME